MSDAPARRSGWSAGEPEAGRALRVAVLGAAGTIGPAIVRDLARSEEVAELLLIDLDVDRAAAVAAEHGGEKAWAAADAPAPGGGPAPIADAISGCDALVNAASYRVNATAMQACLSARCHYLDLGGLYWMTSEQIRNFAPPGGPDRFEQAGLLALLGIGSAPGKTNLMALQAVRRLGSAGGLAAPAGDLAHRGEHRPASLESVHVSAAGRDLEPPPGFSVPYSLRTLLDEMTMRPVLLRDGRPFEIEPLTEAGQVDFGEPIGEAEAIYTLHSEMRTFGSSFGCREASFRLSLAPGLMARLRALASAPEDEVRQAAAAAEPPSARTVAVHLVEATSNGRSARARCVTRPLEDFGIGGSTVSTAAPVAAAVRLLARGAISRRGVLPPERCIEPADLFPELERRGSLFELKLSEEVAA